MRLYGKERDIVFGIYDKSDDEARQYLYKTYASPPFGGLTSILEDLRNLKSRGFIDVGFIVGENIMFIQIKSACRNYPEMERDFISSQNKGGAYMFTKLYGKRREIVEAIYNKEDFEAKQYLISTYADKRGTLEPIIGELKALERDGFVKLNLAQSKLLQIWVLPDCKDYFVLEAENMRAAQTNSTIINVDARESKGNVNVAGRDATNTNQSVMIDTVEKGILELIDEMKNIISESLDIDSDIKENIEDDLDIIKGQMESATPKESIFKKAMQRIETALQPIKNITTVSTLLVHLNTLKPQIAEFISNIPPIPPIM